MSAANYYFTINQPSTATVLGTSWSIEMPDGTPIFNNTEMAWGNILAGESNNKTGTVWNNGTVPWMIYWITDDLPIGWTSELIDIDTLTNANATSLQPSEYFNANLTLTAAASEAPGQYGWNAHFLIVS